MKRSSNINITKRIKGAGILAILFTLLSGVNAYAGSLHLSMIDIILFFMLAYGAVVAGIGLLIYLIILAIYRSKKEYRVRLEAVFMFFSFFWGCLSFIFIIGLGVVDFFSYLGTVSFLVLFLLNLITVFKIEAFYPSDVKNESTTDTDENKTDEQ